MSGDQCIILYRYTEIRPSFSKILVCEIKYCTGIAAGTSVLVFMSQMTIIRKWRSLGLLTFSHSIKRQCLSYLNAKVQGSSGISVCVVLNLRFMTLAKWYRRKDAAWLFGQVSYLVSLQVRLILPTSIFRQSACLEFYEQAVKEVLTE